MKNKYLFLGLLTVGTLGLVHAQEVVIPVPGEENEVEVVGPKCEEGVLKSFENPEATKKCGLSPCFHPKYNYMMSSARRWFAGEDKDTPRCGSFTIEPKSGDIRIQVAKIKYNKWTKDWEPGEVVSWDGKSSWVKIPAAGKKVLFARPSNRCRDYWRMNCTQTMVGTPQIVDCKKVANIKTVNFPIRCRISKRKYKPLNMYRTAEERPAE